MKNKLLKWLFRGYAKGLDEQASLKEEAFNATFDVKDLIRERLKGIRPNHPESGTILENHLKGLDSGERLVFLSKANEALKNETLQVVMKSIIIESEHKAMLEAGEMVSVNFNRATINGAMLIEEELEGLKSMYKEETKDKEKMTEEEKFNPL